MSGTACALNAAPATVPSRAQLFQRHDLVWLTADDPAPGAGETPLPWVVARRSPAQLDQARLALGRSAPDAGGAKPARQSAEAPESAVWRWRPALTLQEVLQVRQRLPEAWVHTLERLLPLQAHFGVTLRVFGSLAWQVLGGEASYLRAQSDLDLLVVAPTQLLQSPPQLQALCEALLQAGSASIAAGGPALDGELRLPGLGDVAWREWASACGRGDHVLVKDAVGVRLALASAAGHAPVPQPTPDALDLWACSALREEAQAWPKPGLVSPVDSGSHHDMDIHLLLRAIDALQGWFAEFARAARAGARFAELAALGRAAEQAMLQATAGVNAYRGAIFNLGLLVAATALTSPGTDPCLEVARRWAADLLAHRPPADSHGQRVRQREGAGGALLQAAQGFPALRAVVLPAYRQAQQAGYGPDRCVVAACLAGIAELEDTNLLWRGGPAGLRWAQQAARDCLDQGGVTRADWCEVLAALHAEFVARHLSPGGSADLAGCAAFLARLPA